MNCCDTYGTCQQGRDCPARTGTVLPHQAAHAQQVARIKSTRPAWLPGEGVPPEAGNFKIVDLGPDDDTDDCQPITHDENMALVRTLLLWLISVVGVVALVSVLVSFTTERYAELLWGLLATLS